MNRNTKSRQLLASIHRDGSPVRGDLQDGLSPGERSLLASLSYCLLCCKERISHSHEHLKINLLSRGAPAAWEIMNWSELPPALRYSLTEVFSLNAVSPHGIDASPNA